MTGSKVAILNHLQTHGSLTSMEAFQLFGVTRLAARIKDLRDRGYIIVTVMMDGTTRFGEPCRYAKYVYRGDSNGIENLSN